MPEIKKTARLDELLSEVLKCCMRYRHEFIMPEHFLLTMLKNQDFYYTLELFCDPGDVVEQLTRKLAEYLMKK